MALIPMKPRGTKLWQDNVDMWPAITHVHVCMYLILSTYPYTKEDLLTTRVWTATRTLCEDG